MVFTGVVRVSEDGTGAFAPSRSRFGGKKSGSLVRFVGEGSEGTGDRDSRDEVGEAGGSIIHWRCKIIQRRNVNIKMAIENHKVHFPAYFFQHCATRLSRDRHMTSALQNKFRDG